MFGGYWEVYDKIPVEDLISFLEFNDFDITLFKEYLSDKFNKTLRKPFTSPDDFDSISVGLVIYGYKHFRKELGTLKVILHFLIYHHYMLLYHKVAPEQELLQMRSKIAKNINLNLSDYMDSKNV